MYIFALLIKKNKYVFIHSTQKMRGIKFLIFINFWKLIKINEGDFLILAEGSIPAGPIPVVSYPSNINWFKNY